MPREIDFPATDLPRFEVNPNTSHVTLAFSDSAKNKLNLQIGPELGRVIVQRLASLFVALATRQGADLASEMERKGNWGQIAFLIPQSIAASAPQMRSHPAVQLCIDRGTLFELNYHLDPEDAERLAQQLQSSAIQARALRDLDTKH